MTDQTRQFFAVRIILVLTVAACAALFFTEPFPQPQQYHQFADQQTLLLTPNFWNVASNAGFLIVGVMGLYQLHCNRLRYLGALRSAYRLFFIAISLVAFGSGYYHLWPDNSTLLWDRLPMAAGFMALFAIIVAEYISVDIGRRLLWPLVSLGITSVLYWHFSEQAGHGDLRYYALVQFLPMLIIPIILLCYRPLFTGNKAYWYLLITYLAAKLLEHFDHTVFEVFDVISGHSLKHIAAAAGLFILYSSYRHRHLSRHQP